MVALITFVLAWSVYLKGKGPAAMDWTFGSLPLDEQMPNYGMVSRGAHRVCNCILDLEKGQEQGSRSGRKQSCNWTKP